MAKFQNLKRINTADFKEEDRPLIEGLSYILNSFMEDVTFALNKNLDFDNLIQEYKTIEIVVDSNGIPKIDSVFKNGLNTRVTGIIVAKVENLTDSTSYSNYPMLYWEENNKIVKIKAAMGLAADNKYKLRIITIG